MTGGRVIVLSMALCCAVPCFAQTPTQVQQQQEVIDLLTNIDSNVAAYTGASDTQISYTRRVELSLITNNILLGVMLGLNATIYLFHIARRG